MKKFCLICLGASLLATGCNRAVAPSQSLVPMPTASSTASSTVQPPLLTAPINDALTRVTKKSFGLKVSPGDSPVSPEKFSGYHTGVDFETTPAEQNVDIPIFAACNGKILLKKYAQGYGGVLVQSCGFNNQNVTIIYGHLRLASINKSVNEQLTAGERLAVLGTGYSIETDGERKHLHFGIHQGSNANIFGYVKNQADLADWLNPTDFLK